MKRKKKVFDVIMMVGMGAFLFMIFAALFVDFTKLEFAIVFIIGIVGYLGSEYYKKLMIMRRRQRGYR